MTTTVPYDSFLPEVLPYVHDCPQFVATNAIRNAAIEFCSKTRCWQVDIAPVDATAGQSNYAVAVPAGTIFVDATEIWIEGNYILPKSPEELTRIFRTVDWRTQQGYPTYVTRFLPSEIYLVPTPKTTIPLALKLRAAIAPSRASTAIDSEVYERYAEQIALGARARLMSTPGQPYFDAGMAEAYRRMFEAAIATIKIKVNKGMSRTSVAVEYQRFI